MDRAMIRISMRRLIFTWAIACGGPSGRLGRARRGTIVAVVERGCEPGLVVPKGMKCPKGGYGRPRQWRTFLVKRRGGSVAYWPQTRSMRLDDARAKGN